jgi:acetyl-CoA carboxylase biotin carboxyl carrier protein
MALSYREVAEILKIIDASACDELILELEGTKFVVRRGKAGNGDAAAGMAGKPRSISPESISSTTTTTTTGAAAARACAPTITKQAAAQERREDGLVEMRAPMIGTFYRAPSPAEPPFVKVGDEVQVGDPLCLIEVMKLFTTIEAQHAGRIAEIGAQNAALVEYDQLLFVIEPY